MERKEILAVILAAAIIIIVIGVLSMIGDGKTPDKPEDSVLAETEQAIPPAKTDVWDVLREQQEALTTTTETTSVIDPNAPEEPMPDHDMDTITLPPTELPPEEGDEGETTAGEQPENPEEQPQEQPEIPDEPAQTAIQINMN